MKEHISFSEWQMWKSCQQRWKLDYLDGRRTPAYGVHMDFGTCIHKAIEKFKCAKVEDRITDPSAYFEVSFNELYEKNKCKYAEKDLKDGPEFFLKAGKVILSRLHECEELDKALVMFNEFPLYEDIERSDDLKIKFKGYIDMIIQTVDKRGNKIIYVIDFKTCSWGWDVEKKRDKDLQAQLLFYKHFLSKKFGIDPKLVRTAFVLLKKKPSKNSSPAEWFTVSAGPTSVQNAIDALNSDLTEMKEREKDNSFIKNRKCCINAYGDQCPFYKTDHCI